LGRPSKSIEGCRPLAWSLVLTVLPGFRSRQRICLNKIEDR
jgi:hypothetical protein